MDNFVFQFVLGIITFYYIILSFLKMIYIIKPT